MHSRKSQPFSSLIRKFIIFLSLPTMGIYQVNTCTFINQLEMITLLFSCYKNQEIALFWSHSILLCNTSAVGLKINCTFRKKVTPSYFSTIKKSCLLQPCYFHIHLMTCCSGDITIVIEVHLVVFMVLFSATKHSTAIKLSNVLYLCHISHVDRKEFTSIRKKIKEKRKKESCFTSGFF